MRKSVPSVVGLQEPWRALGPVCLTDHMTWILIFQNWQSREHFWWTFCDEHSKRPLWHPLIFRWHFPSVWLTTLVKHTFHCSADICHEGWGNLILQTEQLSLFEKKIKVQILKNVSRFQVLTNIVKEDSVNGSLSPRHFTFSYLSLSHQKVWATHAHSEGYITSTRGKGTISSLESCEEVCGVVDWESRISSFRQNH